MGHIGQELTHNSHQVSTPVSSVPFLQLRMAIDKLHTAPFSEVVTEDLQRQFEALLKESRAPSPPPPSSSAASAAAAATARHLAEASGHSGAAVTAAVAAAAQQFPAGQLADVLGLEGPVAFRKEAEAVALEKRKAVEGKDKTQELVMEQVRTGQALPQPLTRG